MPKKYQRMRAGTARPKTSVAKNKAVFISSTYEDLVAHRRAVWQVLERFNVSVKGMERFGARKESALQTCLAEVEQSQVYVGIIGFRLGSLDPDSGKSFTQLEYERALQLDQDIRIYLADESIGVMPFSHIDQGAAADRLAAFKQVLKERHHVVAFSAPDDLAEKIKTDFARILTSKGPAVVQSPAEFDSTIETVKRFLLLPKTVLGREIRLQVRFFSSPFPASRELCKAFNLEYGNTVGAHMNVKVPDHEDVKRYRQVYATGARVDEFLGLAVSGKDVDLYGRIQFSEQDIRSDQAEFFGRSYYDDQTDDGDPFERWVPPQGKALLLFSKASAKTK